MRILSSSAYVSKYLVVEYDHYDRGYVEREHGRVDEKRLVIEAAVVWLPIGRVVQARQHGQSYCHTHYPHKTDRQVDSIRVLVLGIFKRICHGNKSEIEQLFVKYLATNSWQMK